MSCSNLIPLKRVDVIIGAVAKLPKELRVRWDHFGDGAERQRLEVLAKEKLGSNVQWHFHGRVPNNTLAARYAQISPRLFITASSTEGGAPVSIQEAFAMGIPALERRSAEYRILLSTVRPDIFWSRTQPRRGFATLSQILQSLPRKKKTKCHAMPVCFGQRALMQIKTQAGLPKCLQA